MVIKKNTQKKHHVIIFFNDIAKHVIFQEDKQRMAWNYRCMGPSSTSEVWVPYMICNSRHPPFGRVAICAYQFIDMIGEKNRYLHFQLALIDEFFQEVEHRMAGLTDSMNPPPQVKYGYHT